MAKLDRAHEFCMGFVSHSEKFVAPMREKREEVLNNFMVLPDDTGDGYTTPYRRKRREGRSTRSARETILLKDPETHKLVMTYASKLVRSLFGDRNHEYVRAEPVGYEDALKADTVTALLRYVFSRPGHFRTFVESIIDTLLFGTSVIESPWRYEEREMPVRSVGMELGVETSDEQRLSVPVYDDVCLRVIDVFDFYPDPGRYRIEEMPGCAKKFKMNAQQARRMVKAGVYDGAAVEKAIGSRSTSTARTSEDSPRVGRDQPEEADQFSDFSDMVGYEYWGDVPWNADGSSRRVITLLNNVGARDDAWPLADYNLPFHTMIINPMVGRFYGVSPAEIVRYDQAFADAVKMLLATAIIRRVHPPIAYDPQAMETDIDRLRIWRADVPIPVRGGPASIGTIRYDADISSGFALWQGLVQNIQTSSGAPGGIQGEPGPDREAATVGALRLQSAMDQPELAAMVLEEECLPPIGRACLRRYQQFLADTEDLKLRVGEQPEPIWLGDIMGDYDVVFNGSRRSMTRQMKLQSFDRLISYSQVNPAFAAMLPAQEIGQFLVGNLLELPEIAAKIGNPQSTMINLLLTQLLGQGGGKNGVPTTGEPAGMLPAQSAGGMP